MANIEERLQQVEARLERLEQLLRSAIARAAPAAPAAVTRPVVTQSPANTWSPGSTPRYANELPSVPGPRLASATTLLGWAGAGALVLAAAYFIRLAIDAGWLTPERQVGLAVLFALTMIGGGFALRSRDARYASLLPAGGIVVLFLAVYGAHLYYHLIGASVAAAGVALICLGSLAIGRAFGPELYALFAVVGSYSAPFLLPTLRNGIVDLVIYYSAWSVLFCVYALWVGKRSVYLLALYLALLGFDVVARGTAREAWVAILSFQFVQFGVFAAAAVMYSIRRASPMTTEQALAHLPALLLFYVAQYTLLEAHLPAWAPWIALGSLAFLGACYVLARAILKDSLHGAQLLVSAYAALVLFHALYLEAVPSAWAPWVAFLLFPAGAAYAALRRDTVAYSWPLLLAMGVIFAIGYLRMGLGFDAAPVPGAKVLPLLYAVELYLAYYFARNLPMAAPINPALLYAGHISAMSAAVHLLDHRLGVSIAWGALALGCLLLANARRDKVLAQSSLLVFGASALKVLLYDLSGSAPVVRIASLVVVGVTFYAGGWLYQKISAA